MPRIVTVAAADNVIAAAPEDVVVPTARVDHVRTGGADYEVTAVGADVSGHEALAKPILRTGRCCGRACPWCGRGRSSCRGRSCGRACPRCGRGSSSGRWGGCCLKRLGEVPGASAGGQHRDLDIVADRRPIGDAGIGAGDAGDEAGPDWADAVLEDLDIGADAKGRVKREHNNYRGASSGRRGRDVNLLTEERERRGGLLSDVSLIDGDLPGIR